MTGPRRKAKRSQCADFVRLFGGPPGSACAGPMVRDEITGEWRCRFHAVMLCFAEVLREVESEKK